MYHGVPLGVAAVAAKILVLGFSSPKSQVNCSSASFCCREGSSPQRRGRLPSTMSPSCISPPTQIDISTEEKDKLESFLEREDAAAAMDNMDGAELFGRVLTMNYAFPKSIKGEEHRVDAFFCTKSICFKGVGKSGLLLRFSYSSPLLGMYCTKHRIIVSGIDEPVEQLNGYIAPDWRQPLNLD